MGSAPCRRDFSFRSSPTNATSPTAAAMVVQTRGTASTAPGANTESGGSGGAHAASTGTESTQGYKSTSSLIKHFISAMLLVALFSSTVENAYAYVKMLIFMLVSITSFLWIKACCKMARYSTIQKLDRSFSSASFAASLKPPLLQDGGPIRSGICKLRYGSLLCTVSTWSGESASNLPSRLRKKGGLMRQIT